MLLPLACTKLQRATKCNLSQKTVSNRLVYSIDLQKRCLNRQCRHSNCNCNWSFILRFLLKEGYRVIYIYSAKPRLNKTVLRRRLKDVVVDRWSLMSVGRLFHTRGAATANARSPNLLDVRGTYRSQLCAVRILIGAYTHVPAARRRRHHSIYCGVVAGEQQVRACR